MSDFHVDTTRKPRVGEEPGKAYHFAERSEFEEMIRQNKFIEHAVFSGNLYGTSIQAVDDVRATGKRCILDIDSQVCLGELFSDAFCFIDSFLQGVRLVKASHLKPFYLFVAPPSYADLLPRLTGRGTETPEAIEARLAAAKNEIKYAQEPGVHDAFVVNDDIDRAYEVFKSIALGESVQGDPMPEFEDIDE